MKTQGAENFMTTVMINSCNNSETNGYIYICQSKATLFDKKVRI